MASLYLLCQDREDQILPVGTGLGYITEILPWSIVLLYNGNQQIMARLPLFLHCFFVLQASLQPLSPAQSSMITAGSLQLFTASKPNDPGHDGQKKKRRQVQHLSEA